MLHDAGPKPAPVLDDPAVPRLRAVQRAIAELRRGTPVLLAGAAPLVMLSAETAGAQGLRELASVAGGPPVLLLSPIRAASLLRRPVTPAEPVVALRTGALLEPASLHGAADPTLAQLLADPPETAPTPALAAAALALAKLARLLPAVVAAPARADALRQSRPSGLLCVAAVDVLGFPDDEAGTLRRVADAAVPLETIGDARLVAFRPASGAIEHVAIVAGDPAAVPDAAPAPLVRLHSECFTGDLLGSLRCDCGPQLRAALRRIGEAGTGVLLYLAQEGRGIGLPSKLRAYALQDRGLDTVDANRALGWKADERRFELAAQMLRELGVRRVRLLTNNPDKLAALAAAGIAVEGREPLVIEGNGINDAYMATKIRRLGHLK